MKMLVDLYMGGSLVGILILVILGFWFHSLLCFLTAICWFAVNYLLANIASVMYNSEKK